MFQYDLSPYVYCWIFSCLFAYLASKAKSNIIKFTFSLLAILVPSIMAGIRADTVGVDVKTYAEPHFLQARAAISFADFISYQSLLSTKEIGWYALTYISTKTFDSLNWNFFFYNLFTCTFVYIGAWKHRKLAPLHMIMFVFFLMQYNSTYNLMRQALGCSIVFMGFDNLEKKKYWKFLIYIIAASCFHSSALFAIVFILGFHFAITKEWGRYRDIVDIFLCSLILLCFVLAPLARAIVAYIAIFSKYRAYSFARESSNNTVGMMLLGELIVFLLYPKGGRKVFKNSPGGEKMFNYYRYSIAFGIAFYWGARFMARGYFYFEYVNILAYSVLHRFIKNKYLRFLVFMITITALFAYFYKYFVINNREHCGSFPYVTIFD